MGAPKSIEEALRAVMGDAWAFVAEERRYRRGDLTESDRAMVEQIADERREAWEQHIEAMGLGEDGGEL